MAQTYTTTLNADGSITLKPIGARFVVVADVQPPPPPVDPPPVDPPPVDPPPPPPVGATTGIWIGPAEIAKLPMTGAGWTDVLAAAKAASGATNLSNQDSNDSTYVKAAALVYARTGEAAYLAKVKKAITDICTKNLESGSRALALGRELIGYVLAADIVQLKTIDPDLDAKWRTKLAYLLTYKTSQAGSLIDCSLDRPNNWGGHSRASWLAAALYLGDKAGADRAVATLKGWMGEWDTYHGFSYGTMEWQIDKARPVGVLPKGATIQGYNVDGGQPEELRRVSFHIPPSNVVYTWEGLQGPIAAAEMAHRAGYTDIWECCDKALLRAVEFNYRQGWPAEGDDKWIVPIINRAYGVTLPVTGGGAGKNVGWSLWTHAQ